MMPTGALPDITRVDATRVGGFACGVIAVGVMRACRVFGFTAADAPRRDASPIRCSVAAM